MSAPARRQVVRPAAPEARYSTIEAGTSAVKAYLQGSGPQTCHQIARGMGVGGGAKFAQNTRLSHLLSLAIRRGEIHAVARPQAKRTKLYSVVAADGRQFLPFELPVATPKVSAATLACSSHWGPSSDGPPFPFPPDGNVARVAPVPSGAPRPADDDLEQRADVVVTRAEELRQARAEVHEANRALEDARQAVRDREVEANRAAERFAAARTRLRQAMQVDADTG